MSQGKGDDDDSDQLLIAIYNSHTQVVQFSDMNEVYVDFIRKVLEPLFSQCDDSTVESVFTKIPKKDNFASAIKLFISCFMSADSKSKLNSVRQFQLKMKI